MPRKRTGAVEFRGGCWHARVTQNDGSRPWIAMPGIPKDDEATARAVAAEMSIQTKNAVPASRGETVSEYARRWCLARGDKGDNLSHIKTHVDSGLGPLPMAAVSRAHLEDFVTMLDDKVKRAEIRWKTARNVWGTVSKMFSDATNAKKRELRAITSNPALGVSPPDKGEKTAKQYLYPDEFLALVGASSVPLVRARLYACTVYTYAREGEIIALNWQDVDLSHGRIHYHSAIDRVRAPDVIGSTKNGVARRIGVEPELMPLLERMAEEKVSERVFPAVPNVNGRTGIARLLRADLLAAGVDRKELHEPTLTRKAMTFHDLRATGITWMAVRGDNPLVIQKRAGHLEFSTTQGYIREAEVNREGFGEVFPALPARLLGESPKNSPIDPKPTKRAVKLERETGLESVSKDAETPSIADESTRSEVLNRPTGNRSHGAESSLESALSKAILLAAHAGEWETVQVLTHELSARRRAATGVRSDLEAVPSPKERRPSK